MGERAIFAHIRGIKFIYPEYRSPSQQPEPQRFQQRSSPSYPDLESSQGRPVIDFPSYSNLRWSRSARLFLTINTGRFRAESLRNRCDDGILILLGFPDSYREKIIMDTCLHKK